MDFTLIASQLHNLTTLLGVLSGAATFALTSIRVVQVVRRHRRRSAAARTVSSAPRPAPVSAAADTAAAPALSPPDQLSAALASQPPPPPSPPEKLTVAHPHDRAPGIRTPDQRLRVFVSSTIEELAQERAAASQAISRLKLTPILFELGARPHPPRSLYRAYLAQSDIFIGLYWQRYGWVAPGEEVSGLEDEYRLSGERPKLIYLKSPAADREPRLRELLDRIRTDDHASYKSFRTLAELRRLIANDLAVLLSERFAGNQSGRTWTPNELAESTHSKSNLPLQLTSFVGRDAEVADVIRLLDEHRLVTLTGAGGTGKTRLAIEVAERMHDKFVDGVWFVDLAAISDPNLVARTIVQALGVPEITSQPVQDSVEEFLRSRQLLLVLDNMEHLLQAAPQISALLAASPGLRILATSREPLALHGEWELAVAPLAMPDALDTSPDDLENIASVALFVQCAQAIIPEFALNEDNASAVASICRRLDGLPLAIELAAARLRLLSPEMLLRQLGHRLGVLTGGARDLPARQRTLRGAIDWSYQLLAPGEQALCRRLAVFVGGASVELVDEVCTAAGGIDGDILDGLQSLLAKNLLVRAHHPTGDRVRMLETIREYALDQLELAHEAEPTRRQHADVFLQLSETADRSLRGDAQTLWMQRLSVELENLRAAMKWAEDKCEVATQLRLAGGLARFWWRSGHMAEGREWLAAALAPGQVGEPLDRARALAGAGLLADKSGDHPHATEYLDEAVAMSRNLGDQWLTAYAMLYRADVAYEEGDLLRARELNDESLALFRAVDDDWGIGAALNALGVVTMREGQYAAARPLYEEALRRARARREPIAIAIGLGNLAQIDVFEGDYPAAVESGTSALRFEPVRDTDHVASVLEELGAAAAGLGQLDRAVRLYAAAASMRHRVGAPGTPGEITLHERVIARARSAMEAAAFDAAWAEGRAFSADQAVEYALKTTANSSLVAGAVRP